jgi:hypothetical protein
MCVAAAALTASANARAQAWPHYYGTLVADIQNGDADQGSAIDIFTNALGVWDCNSIPNFVNHEMWYGVNIPPPGQLGYWVEVGFNDGTNQNGSCDYDIYMWADNRNGGGYHEHYFGSGWSFNTWYQAVVQQQPNSCNWDVWLGNAYLGTSTSNCPGSGRQLSAGIESSTQSGNAWAKGFLEFWEELDSSRTWWMGWDGAGGNPSNPPYIQWADSNQTETEEVLNEPW